MRDKRLDYYRGIIMIYIVGVIHVLYWSGLGTFKYKSLFLVEMIYIFFITGASYSFSPMKSYKEYLLRRVERCMIPFFIYNLIVLILNIQFSNYQININTVWHLFDPRMIYNKLNFLNWHIWFLPIYLLLIPTIPILYNFYIKTKGYQIPIIFAVFIFLIDMNKVDFKGIYYIRNIVFYSIFIYFGFFYKDYNFNKNKTKHIILIILCTLILFLLRNFYSFNMQINKFPPNFIFLVYTFLIFNISLFFRNILIEVVENLKILKKSIEYYAKHNYTLYLYHPFIYLILFSNKLLEINKLNIGILMIIIVILNMINGKLFYRFEKINIKNIGERFYEKLYKINEN